MITRYASLASRWLFLVTSALTLALSVNAQSSFVHPGGLHTQADLDRMKAQVAAGAHPWIDGWNQLLADTTTLLSYGHHATANMGSSRQNASRDAHAAYNAVLRWYISGDTAYADKAVQICNAWSAVVNQVPSGSDIPGLSGIPVSEFAQVGELLRIYPGWAAADFDRFKNMMLTYWYPVCHNFLTNHNGTCDTHYWANWDLCNMGAILSIGVLCDDQAKFDEAVVYLQSGIGNGNIWKTVPFIHPNGLGQWQESGRDQEHAQLGVGLLAGMCEVAWNQGVDLYGYAGNRLLAGAEYVARTNLSQPVPYTPYNNCDNVNQYYLSINGIGRVDDRPIWEMIYNHYVVRKGLSAPNVQAMAGITRPERGSADHFGYGTLTYTLNAASSPHPFAPVPPAVTNLKAAAHVSHVELSWTPPVGDTTQGYQIQRATAAGGPYTTVASWSANTWPQYSDWSVTNGTTYYYVVSPLNQSGVGAVSAEASATPLAATATMPAGWAQTDLGPVLAPGSATYSTTGYNTFIVNGSGSAVGGTADSIGFTGASASGDLTFTARLSGMGGALGKIGIMIRESLAPDAPMIFIKRGDVGWRQAAVAVRTAAGGNTAWVAGNDYTWLPTWFKLQRVGNTFTAYQSNDGADWVVVTSATIAISQSCYIGFAVCTGSPTGALGSGTFDHVTVTDEGAVPAAPDLLTATGVGSRQIDLAWSASSGASAYTVKRSSSSAGPFVTVASNLSGNSYSDTGLSWMTTYHYVVSAGNVAGESPDSTVASGTTLAPDIPPPPAKLMAAAGDARVVLSWSASPDGTSYTVKRSAVSGGPYVAVGTVADTHFADTTTTNGTTYYYVVSASNLAGEGAESVETRATPGVGAFSYWPFDETAGATATDAWGARDGALASGATWSAGAFNSGVKLDGTANGYVALPSGVVSTLADFTISTWVRLDASANWARLFDFGSGTTNYMFLTPRHGASGNGVRFAIRTPSVGEQTLNGPALSTGLWTHLAVTHAGNVGILYINGIEVARHTAMTLAPANLGVTTQNWIGKSQFNDPLLNGAVDDFRLYNRALSVSEISDLIGAVAPAGPTGVVATVDGSTVVLNWSASPEATSYTVKRASVSGGPYTTVASNLSTTSFTDTGTAAGGAYYYVVTARSGSFESVASSQVSALLPPGGLLASGWNGRVDLSWANANGASGYVVKRGTASGGPYTTVATAAAATYSDSGLINGTRYYYVVSATTALGESPECIEVAATPVSDPVADTWSHGDVGSVGVRGNTRYAGGVYTLNGGGADIWFQADGFQFAHQPMTGDGAIMARVLTQLNTSGIAKAGVMMRENLTTNSRHALINHTPNNVMEFIRRTAPNVNAVATTSAGAPLAHWVRLVRSGNTFTAYHSDDGVPNWTTLGAPQSITMGTTPYVGLVVSAGNNGALGEATFDHVNIATVAPVITSAATATATFNASFSYTIQAANTAALYTATGLPAGVTLDADTGVISGVPEAAGVFDISIGAINAMGSATATLNLTVSKAAATVNLAGLAQPYDGTARAVTATTIPEGLAVNVTYDGSAEPPIYPGNYVVVGTIEDANYQGTTTRTHTVTVTVLVRHAPALGSIVDGSVQMLLPESLSFKGGTALSGDLLMPGTPTIQLNGSPTYAGIEDGPGLATPTNYSLTLVGSSVVRYLVRRVDPIALPAVAVPPAPAGSRSVTIKSAGQTPGNFATLRDLTLNSGVGNVAVPPGTYGSFTANTGAGFVLGVAGATEPAIYNLQTLTLNSTGTLQVVGPIILTMANGMTISGTAGNADHPAWLVLNVASGGVTLNSGAALRAIVSAPAGTMIINDGATLVGRVAADRFTLNIHALLDGVAP